MSWRIGISTGACTDRPILDVLPAIHATGATGVEVGTPPRHFNPWSDLHVQELDHDLRALNLHAVSIHAVRRNDRPQDANPDHRLAAIGAHGWERRPTPRWPSSSCIPAICRVTSTTPGPGCTTPLAVWPCSPKAARLDSINIESPLPSHHGAPDELLCSGYRRQSACASIPVLSLAVLATVRGRRGRPLVARPRQRQPRTLGRSPAARRGPVDWADVVASLRHAHFRGWIMLELACPGAQALDEHLRQAFDRSVALLTP
jgi:hypothetical protein